MIELKRNISAQSCRATSTHGLLSPLHLGTPAVLIGLALFLVGCGPESEIRRYVVEPETERIFTSDALKNEFGAIPFEWEVPENWKLARNDQFSKVAWEVGPRVDGGRITVSDVSMGMGLVSQLTRWRGQIGLTEPEDGNPMSGTTQIKLGEISATYVDFEGADESILGMMFPRDEKLWVFKFRGANAVVKAEKERFRKFAESVKIP